MTFKEYYFNEVSQKGKGISFVDIDETLFFTYAKIYVIKDGSILKELSNTEFNTYELQDGESFDFSQFKDSKLFKNTSKPITDMINRVRIIFDNIQKHGRGSKMYLLTARADFNDKEEFISFLQSYGLPIGHEKDGLIHVIRAGNKPGSGSAIKKKVIIKELLEKDYYRRVRIYDDADSNLKEFLNIPKELTKEYISKVKDLYDIPEGEPIIEFEAYKVHDGKTKLYKKEKIK